jgi:hypothetical protein
MLYNGHLFYEISTLLSFCFNPFNSNNAGSNIDTWTSSGHHYAILVPAALFLRCQPGLDTPQEPLTRRSRIAAKA